MSAANDPMAAVASINDELADIATRLTRVTARVADLTDGLAASAFTDSPQASASPLSSADAAVPVAADSDRRQAPEPAAVLAPPVRPVPPKNRATAPSPVTAPPVTAPPVGVPQLQYATAHPGFAAPQYQPAPFPAPLPAPPRIPAAPNRLTAVGTGGQLGKVLAFAGVAITLIGVVLLLVLAAQAGLLAPQVRVAGGAVLAAALVGAGIVVGRSPAKRSAAAALAATGIATALFCVLAATNIYHWLPALAALVLTGMIAAGGFVVARLWDSQPLGLAVGVGLVLLAPFLADGDDAVLLAFLLVYAAATLAVQIGRDWPALFAVNTAATAVPLVLMLGRGGDASATAFLIGAAAAFVLAIASAIALLRSSGAPVALALAGSVPLLPMLGADVVLATTPAALLWAGVAAVLITLTVAGSMVPGSTLGTRTVWLAGAAVAGVAIVAILGGADALRLGFLGVALALGLGSRFGAELAASYRIVGTVALGAGLLSIAPQAAMALSDADWLGAAHRTQVFTTSVLALAALAALGWSWVRGARGSQATVIACVGGLIALALINVLCVAAAAVATDGSDAGFRSGHLAATVIFAAAGAAALMWARRLRGTDRALALTAGLLVLATAVAKLFLFDLSALDGIFRVAAFILVGLVLLGLGVAYAQTLDDEPSSLRPSSFEDPPTGPIPVAPIPVSVTPQKHR